MPKLDQPDFSQKVTAILLGRNIQVEADLVDQLFNASDNNSPAKLLMSGNFSVNSD